MILRIKKNEVENNIKSNLKDELLKRKSNFIAELRALSSMFNIHQKSMTKVSKLIELISNAPDELFLDKIFFENNKNKEYSRKISVDNHLLALKKIHKIFLNYSLLTDKQKLLLSDVERSFMNLYLKGVSSSNF